MLLNEEEVVHNRSSSPLVLMMLLCAGTRGDPPQMAMILRERAEDLATLSPFAGSILKKI